MTPSNAVPSSSPAGTPASPADSSPQGVANRGPLYMALSAIGAVVTGAVLSWTGVNAKLDGHESDLNRIRLEQSRQADDIKQQGADLRQQGRSIDRPEDKIDRLLQIRQKGGEQ